MTEEINIYKIKWLNFASAIFLISWGLIIMGVGIMINDLDAIYRLVFIISGIVMSIILGFFNLINSFEKYKVNARH